MDVRVESIIEPTKRLQGDEHPAEFFYLVSKKKP